MEERADLNPGESPAREGEVPVQVQVSRRAKDLDPQVLSPDLDSLALCLKLNFRAYTKQFHY